MELVKVKDIPKSILSFQELMCSCGQPEQCWEWLLSYLQKLASGTSGYQFDTKVPTEWLAVYIVHQHCGMTTHGGGILSSWLTPEGRKACDWLLVKGTEFAGNMVIDCS